MATYSIAVLALATACSAAAAAPAPNAWPTRPIRLVVPAVPGGAIDVSSRVIGERLAAAVGQQVIVDNRPGADGTIGLDAVARANADGHTLIAVTDALIVLRFLYPKLPFDPQTSFAPVILIATQPRALTVHPSVPASNVREFVALAKAKPGTLSYATGSAAHRLTAELIKHMAGIDLVNVPYKGGAQAVAELMGGQVPSAVTGLSPVLPQARANKLRILAVTTAARSAFVPNVPTLSESGLGGFDVYEWIVLLAPAGTPGSIVKRLNGEVAKILIEPAVRERFAAASLDPRPGAPAEVQVLIREGGAQWGKLIKDLGLRLEL